MRHYYYVFRKGDKFIFVINDSQITAEMSVGNEWQFVEQFDDILEANKFVVEKNNVRRDYVVDFHIQGITAAQADDIENAIILIVENAGAYCCGRVKDAEEGAAANG